MKRIGHVNVKALLLAPVCLLACDPGIESAIGSESAGLGPSVELDKDQTVDRSAFVGCARPELVVAALVLPDPAATQAAVWQLEIRNVSAFDVDAPFTVLLAADGYPFYVTSVAGLAAFASKTLQTTTGGSPAGSEVITATVDYTNAIEEASECQGADPLASNTLTKTLTTGKVQLAVTRLQISPAQPVMGKPLTLTYDITNKGSVASTQPFYVAVSPGAFNGNVHSPELVRITTPLPQGGTITRQHKVVLERPGSYQATVDLDASLGMPDYVYKNGIAPGASARTQQFFARGMYNGRLYDSRPNITAAELEAYVQGDPGLSWYRRATALLALQEMQRGLCGDAARERYDAGGSWCSEFARWVYLSAGLEDRRYGGFSSLSDVTLTKELVAFFDSQGQFVWRPQVGPATVEVGDYLAETTMGKPKNHSAIVVAVTADSERIWIAQGNAKLVVNGSEIDCVYLQPMGYVQQGALHGAIDGIGKLSAELFGSISVATYAARR